MNTLTKSRIHIAEHGIVNVHWVTDEKDRSRTGDLMCFKEPSMNVRTFALIVSGTDGHCALLNQSDYHILSLLGNLIGSPNYHF